ncbi:class I SAM-dependent methyltransferase [uncultured Roseibium sp.]|uniref:class I SAM-dependent methyltransferase n=1 Tax=uncultured Roseibium sp. TaxID=1936171 RepID=UPI00261DBE53|nr:class I SAM-dependent methyltransferase [uncultured Roseibium sp.]
MSGFSSKWLALREPLDLAARNQDVETAFLKQLPASSPRLLDLASGAGSTVAALKDQLPADTTWTLTDHDSDLIAVAHERWQQQLQGELSLRQVDLAAKFEDLPFPDVDAITTSAFLDLVSDDFLVRLVDCVVRVQKPFLASLTYDGRITFAPPASLDQTMLDALNSDQRLDKGFGPALGPLAAERAIELFKARGYEVVKGTSDWVVGPADEAFLDEFLSGWSGVGLKNGTSHEVLEEWRSQHLTQMRSGDIRVTIGHIDFAAFPKSKY